MTRTLVRTLDRIPPQNLEAEQSVLGCMLLDRDAIAKVAEALSPSDFYREIHGTICSAILELFDRGEPADLVTVTNRLQAMGKLEDAGGATYLASLPNAVPTAANVEHYAGIVLEKSLLRSLIAAGTEMVSLGYDEGEEVETLLDRAERAVFAIGQRRRRQEPQSIREILRQSFEKIDRRYQHKGAVTGLATGFTDLDLMTSGLQPGT